MYLLYLDASGSASTDDRSLRHYVLLGVCLHEGNWFALEKRVQGLKRRYEIPGQALELHAKGICVSITEQEEISGFAAMGYIERRAKVLALREEKLKGKTAHAQRAARERAALLPGAVVFLCDL